MTYDANGNTLADGMNSYSWDARNRLVSADNNSASFSYDPLGRRTAKKLLSTTTGFLYGDANALQEQSSGAVTANLLTGGVDARFTRTDANGTYDCLTDALGSTMSLTVSTGVSQTQYSYSLFGVQSASGAATTNSYTYTGRETDGLGIDYCRARYYNPATGRFLSEDPAGFRGGINQYANVGDSPLNFVDPFGMDKKPPCSGLNCMPWPLLGMAGGGPRGNPQFNTGQGVVNQPGAHAPPHPWTPPAGEPPYVPPAPGDGQPPPLGLNPTDFELLQAAAWTTMNSMSDFLMRATCNQITVNGMPISGNAGQVY